MVSSKSIPEISVTYDVKMDLMVYGFLGPQARDVDLNILKTYLPKELLNNLIKSNFSERLELEKYLNEFSKNNSEYIKKTVDYVKKFWEKESDHIITELESFYETVLKTKKISLYLTTYTRFPYNHNENWFAIGFKDRSDCEQTIKHELNHFYFHQVFGDKDNRLNDDEFYLLKESFSVTTLPDEGGYEGHEELRKYIKDMVEKNKKAKEIYELSIKKLTSK